MTAAATEACERLGKNYWPMLRHLKTAFIAAAFLSFALPVRADEMQITSTPAPAGQQRSWNIDGTTFTGDEVLHLFAGMHKALDQNDSSIHVSLQEKKASEMPAFDPKWHCAEAVMQPDNSPKVTIWIADDSAHDLALFKTAVEACIFTGLAETGYGGPTWKALYDRFAAEDAALGPNAPVPNLNRRRLGLQLAGFYDQVSSGKLTESPSPSPSASTTGASSPPASSTSGKRTLQLDIPPGWVRTESGRYNEWRLPDGSNFRVTPMAVAPEYQGAGAADAVKETFEKIAVKLTPNAQVTVVSMKVCNGEQTAYRVNDLLGPDSAGFMVVIPGPTSTGLINYEAHGSVDPLVLQTIAKVCWP